MRPGVPPLAGSPPYGIGGDRSTTSSPLANPKTTSLATTGGSAFFMSREIQAGARIGARCKISSHSFICEGVTIEDEVFIGHGVMFTNDKHPKAATADGRPQQASDWTLQRTHVGKGASIGSNATILCGVTIGAGASVGAGSVVTKDVAPGATVAGVPARTMSAAGSEAAVDRAFISEVS